MRRLGVLIYAGLMLMGAVGSLRAQIVADGATNTLSNATNSIPGNVTVGTNGSFTLLVLSNNCLLTNSGFSTIGANATAKSNEVRLVSPTARWFMGASSANSLFVGSNSAGNRLVVSNGATAAGQGQAFLGYISESASNNQVWVTGSNSVWSSAQSMNVGVLGSGNQVVVSNGGTVLSVSAVVGASTITSNNLALVTGAGSLWSNAFTFSVGANGSGNRLLVSEGGVVRSGGIGRIGGEVLTGSGNNLALVTGSGSVWSNTLDLEIGRSSGINNQLVVSNGASAFVGGNALLGASSGPNSNSVLATDLGTSWFVLNNLYVGSNGALSRLVVTNSATVTASNVFVGFNASSTNNFVIVDGGTLRVTNAAGAGTLDLRRGFFFLNAGSVEVDHLLVTNSGQFQFSGGTLSARNSTVTNGSIFGIGDGTRAATFFLAGNGLHKFNTFLSVTVAGNATVTGNGTIGGPTALAFTSLSRLMPGVLPSGIGKIILSNSPSLQGTVIMDISKNGSVVTNDQIQVTGTLTYGGALTVTNIGTNALTAEDKFQLFNATSYAGSFASLTLPPLDSGLGWTNKLLVDGSIEVVGFVVQTLPATAIGQTNATLNGAVNPGGANATAWFEWGSTTDYGNITPPQALGGGFHFTNFSQVLTGLTTGVIYHFRAVASNNQDVVFGSNRMVRPFLPLFADNFDSDHTSNWRVNSDFNGFNAADFFFDYSSIGIPPAPNSMGTTRGLKLEANYAGSIFTGLSVSPIGQNFTGDYVLLFDIWWNYVVERAGVTGATQITGAGVGTAGTTPQWSAVTKDSVFFGVTGDGGSGLDYRAYSAVVTNDPYQSASGNYEGPSGVYAAGSAVSSVNNSDSYYAPLGGNPVPAAQTAIDPGQMGTSPPGAPGFRWHRGRIIKEGNTISFNLNDLLIATVDASPLTLGGGNILFNQFDVNSSSVTAGYSSFEFGLIDNVVVAAIDPLQWLGIRKLANEHIQLIGSGVPGRAYSVEAATNLNFTQAGSTIGTVTADAGGMIIFEDTALPPNISRFYRLRWP